MKPIHSLLTALLLTTAPLASIAQAADLSSCPALNDEKAYEDDYDDYRFMVPGKDGWLFRSRQDFKTEFKASNERIENFTRLSQLLKQKGTQLIIAFPPTRGMAAASKIPANNKFAKDYNVAAATKNYSAFIQAMNNAGVRVVGNPSPKTGAGYFYKADHHWTNEGAREMAQVIAAAIKQYPAFKTIKQIVFETTPTKGAMLEGNFNEAIEGLCHVKMPAEKANGTQTIPLDAKSDESALFGDTDFPQIVLVGTSNSKREEFDMNFEGHLKQALSADVYNAAVSGGGMDDSILAYLASDKFRKSPPKFLIWEIPGYYNLGGEDAAKMVKKAISTAD